MKVDLFDFDLPEELISLRPLANREQAKMLHIDSQGFIKDLHVSDIVSLLRPNDVLVFNDTKVIPANLKAQRFRKNQLNGAASLVDININLLEPVSNNSWKAFLKPLKRVNIGEELIFETEKNIGLKCKLIKKLNDGAALLEFNFSDEELKDAIHKLGHIPLPPYIAARRELDEKDKTDYQTVYAKHYGAVASPTAGLHFTNDLLEKIKKLGIKQVFVTLHVGAGTFLPVKVDDTLNHKMHSEVGYIDNKTADELNKIKDSGGRIIAVGTTSLRLLESAVNNDRIKSWSGPTDIFITPGYKFNFVDCLITNFHLPKSTLFMLVSAFCGLEQMRNAYIHAIKNKYRFYSYGDTSFLELNKNAK